MLLIRRLKFGIALSLLLPMCARAGSLYSNDFSSSTTGFLSAYPSSLSLVNSPFTGSQALQFAFPNGDTYYAGPNIYVSNAQLATTPIVTETVRMGLASPPSQTALHGVIMGMELVDDNNAHIADLKLFWDPDHTVSNPSLPAKHIYLGVTSDSDTRADATSALYDLSNAAVDSSALTAFGSLLASVSVNYATGTTSFSVNGVSLPFAGSFAPGTFAGSNYQDLEVTQATGGQAYTIANEPRAIFDDYTLTTSAVPEPTGLLVASILIPIMLQRRRMA